MEYETQKETLPELPLLGGQLTPGIVRVGNTVRRPSKSNADFVHELLRWLALQSFDFAPHFLGVDEQGRDILTYLEGKIWPYSGATLPDELLVQAAQIIRRYHDLTAHCPLAQGQEIVAHYDLGPHNTIFQGNRIIGLIDWDDAAPGTRLRDLSNAVYNYVDVGHWGRATENQTTDEQARRIHMMCTAYGWDDPIALINDFEADLQQALRNHKQARRVGAIKIFTTEVNWMCQRAQELRRAFDSLCGPYKGLVRVHELAFRNCVAYTLL